jgi:glucose-6-phosphate isomerase
MGRLTDLPQWQALQGHHQAIEGVHLRSLFADDPSRGERLTATVGDVYLDYSTSPCGPRRAR